MSAQSPVKADPPQLIFVHGDIIPGVAVVINRNGTSTSYGAVFLERVQALAVRDGRIVATGTDAEIRKLAGPKTRIVDLGGHFVLPGFNDAHTHLFNAGWEKLTVDVNGVKSLQEMLARVATGAKATPAGDWVTGRGWDHTLWPGQKLPTRQDLDKVTGDHPALFTRVDGHISVANTAALKWAGITRETPDPPGGKIDHDAQGEPTGILRETVKDDLLARLPKPSAAQRRRALELALEDAARHGVTSVQDNSTWDDFLVMEAMEREGKLPVRVSEWLKFDDPVDVLIEHRKQHPADDPMLHTAMLKGFMDGSLGSRTAALLAPYSDDPGNSGLPRYEQEKLNAMTVERARAGFQIGFHAIGDRAAQMALDAFAAAEDDLRQHCDKDPTALRFRIEHDQVIAPAQFAQYKRLGVIASVQPNHLLTDMHWAVERIGPERAKTSYPWKEFLDSGVSLAFGTDYPIEPITPLRGLYAAVTRMDEPGKKTYYPEQGLSREQAISAYTSGSAFAQFAEKEKGVLEPGYLADFVVLDRDLTKVAPAEILKTKVLRTVVGGKTVYEAK
ncbi:MAG TPA: amidohydrolase [Terriglobales bacterium]|nr:amidohydrolase [Terriglobales bacterium]